LKIFWAPQDLEIFDFLFVVDEQLFSLTIEDLDDGVAHRATIIIDENGLAFVFSMLYEKIF
jgi:hypothetical protein